MFGKDPFRNIQFLSMLNLFILFSFISLSMVVLGPGPGHCGQEAIRLAEADGPQSAVASGLDDEEYDDDEYDEWDEEDEGELISDPIEPVNRFFFQFNDKMYFWVLKPVAQGYSKVMPEPARKGIKNFFSHIYTPVRMANCMLQLDAPGFFQELARFIINTTAGCLGFRDAAFKDYHVKKNDTDFGQTLAVWGTGNGFYLVLPFFGPSSVRDGIGLGVDHYLSPWTYMLDRWELTGATVGEKVNATSLRIGEYEDFKASALDPYISLRQAYVSYRNKLISEAGKPYQVLGLE